MYDALLEEFEDDPSRAPEEEEGFPLQPLAEVEVEEVDEDLEPVDGPVEQEVAIKPEEEGDLLAGLDENESWSDDPVRMYLTQMGEIPLLTRDQEIALAKRIEVIAQALKIPPPLLPRMLIRRLLESALDSVRLHFLAQRIAIDAEHLCRVRLVAGKPVQYRLEQRLFDAVAVLILVTQGGDQVLASVGAELDLQGLMQGWGFHSRFSWTRVSWKLGLPVLTVRADANCSLSAGGQLLKRDSETDKSTSM